MCSVKLDPSCFNIFLSITRYVDEDAVGKQKEGESIFLFGALIRIPVKVIRISDVTLKINLKKLKLLTRNQLLYLFTSVF